MTEINGIEIDSADVEWPEIVTICGSMRFYTEMLQVAAELTLDDCIVLAPFCVVASNQQAETVKEQLDELHLRKIDMAYRVIVVTNQDGYIGDSTRREMAYALGKGKQVDVREFRTEPVTVDGKRVIGAGHVIG